MKLNAQTILNQLRGAHRRGLIDSVNVYAGQYLPHKPFSHQTRVYIQLTKNRHPKQRSKLLAYFRQHRMSSTQLGEHLIVLHLDE